MRLTARAHRVGHAASVAAVALACVAAGGKSGRAATPSLAYVDVAVATLWATPMAPRPVDRPALTNPVAMRAWTASLDTEARRGLVGRIETQALYGDSVRVIERRGSWVRVAAVGQPTPRDGRGYPGWVPSAQITTQAEFETRAAGPVVVVTRPTAWLQGPGRRFEVSYGTRLPLVGTSGPAVLVATPDGWTGRIARTSVTRFESAADIPRPSGGAIATAARAFVGVRYLWGGRSAFGFDCSGLIELVYRAFGVAIPRDADAQARAGHAVASSRLDAGDLLFYGRAHVHHVTLYLGGGRMLEAPNSALSVRITSVRKADYAGARRYVP